MTIVHSFDTSVAKLVARLPKWLEKPFTLLGLVTSPLIWVIIMLGSLSLTPPDSLLNPQIVILVALPLATISKFAFRRHRPPTIYAGRMRIKSYSFPSSHSYATALASTWLAIGLFAAGYWLAASLLLALTLIVGTSRIYLGAHYPSDVLAGWLSGGLIAAGVAAWL